jgi:hypothetical protein
MSNEYELVVLLRLNNLKYKKENYLVSLPKKGTIYMSPRWFRGTLTRFFESSDGKRRAEIIFFSYLLPQQHPGSYVSRPRKGGDGRIKIWVRKISILPMWAIAFSKKDGSFSIQNQLRVYVSFSFTPHLLESLYSFLDGHRHIFCTSVYRSYLMNEIIAYGHVFLSHAFKNDKKLAELTKVQLNLMVLITMLSGIKNQCEFLYTTSRYNITLIFCKW